MILCWLPCGMWTVDQIFSVFVILHDKQKNFWWLVESVQTQSPSWTGKLTTETRNHTVWWDCVRYVSMQQCTNAVVMSKHCSPLKEFKTMRLSAEGVPHCLYCSTHTRVSSISDQTFVQNGHFLQLMLQHTNRKWQVVSPPHISGLKLKPFKKCMHQSRCSGETQTSELCWIEEIQMSWKLWPVIESSSVNCLRQSCSSSFLSELLSRSTPVIFRSLQSRN